MICCHATCHITLDHTPLGKKLSSVVVVASICRG